MRKFFLASLLSLALALPGQAQSFFSQSTQTTEQVLAPQAVAPAPQVVFVQQPFAFNGGCASGACGLGNSFSGAYGFNGISPFVTNGFAFASPRFAFSTGFGNPFFFGSGFRGGFVGVGHFGAFGGPVVRERVRVRVRR